MDGARPSRPDRPYQRTYKACIPCRARKAKCDLGTGPDGLPIGPPCARCRREMRECVFPEKRAWERSRKRGRSVDDNEQVSPVGEAAGSSPEAVKRHFTQAHQSQYPDTTSPFQQGWSFGHQQSPQNGHCSQIGISPVQAADVNMQTNPSPSQSYHDHRHRSSSTLASSMMRTVVASGNDALNILFEAATAQDQEDNTSNETDTPHRVGSKSGAPNGRERSTPRNFESPTTFESAPRAQHPVSISDVDPETLQVWEACRFVRMGWFTAREAVTFVDLFFKNMCCLSPILTFFYSNHRHHYWLISREPVLCCTILMVSSRYHILPGAGGDSRNFFIHHRLWQHCQQLTMRLIFGQEKSTKSKIRSLGTVEALLLMAEWHPRSLHFPPEMDGWDDDLILSPSKPSENTDSNPNSANRWLEDMIEPSRRSDQMSWMLLGCALSLAHELGIFETEETNSPDEEQEWKEQMTLRRQRVQRLLYVYINQLAWRIGCMSPIPQSLNHAVLGGRKPRGLSQPGSTWLIFMDSWIELTKLAQSVTDMFFPSAKFARQQLHSGRYVGLLEHFRPLLNQWKDKYLQPDVLDKAFYNDLFIEYHFVRVYTHSVGMQAVVERVVADADSHNFDEVRPMTIDPTDYDYIQEVIDGCCQILQKCIHLPHEGTQPGYQTSSTRGIARGAGKSISALKSNALDDVHLSTRYATLLDLHVSRLRRNLLASSKNGKHSRGATRRSSMGPPPWPDNGDRPNTMNTPVSQDLASSDLNFIPSINEMDDWLSLPFDPSMAPFSMSTGAQFPMCEGGALDFIWNLPS
ncbi:hypothetical protein N7532_008712 [Penicillium argentinense]|uniref:Zn(2)-C6 fungal-type domain-containing protein n=1 Tax=Penicillium argentinense TaxID=1131581 RepID=A0A9W9K1X5_9EURO|nr:uncharacterized protein N7532_008712 [Penicillium argentinense]KAJ5090028.1 hypothetical protein N7532_008712 [Penicillium argentinense]